MPRAREDPRDGSAGRRRGRAAATRAAALAALWVAAAWAGAVHAQFVTRTYEEPPFARAGEILDDALLRSPVHRVDDRVEVEGNFFRFELDSDYGHYRPGSLALLRERVHEIRTLDQALSQYRRADEEFAESLRGRLYVGGDSVADILGSPLDTASQLAGQFADNLGETVGVIRGSRTRSRRAPQPTVPVPPDAAENRPVLQAHKRSVANLYGLDPYSSNPRVQEFLYMVAQARSAGRFTAGVATLTVPGRNLRRVAGGTVDNRISSRIKDNGRDELRALMSRQLAAMGVAPEVREQFLAHPALSPRHQATITGHLEYLDGVENRELVVQAALEARTEEDALSYEQLARMYAVYHETLEKLRAFDSSGGTELPVGITRSKALVVALPVDVVYWSEQAYTTFNNLARRAQEQNYSRREAVASGVLTERAKRQLGGLVFDHRERYLRKR